MASFLHTSVRLVFIKGAVCTVESIRLSISLLLPSTFPKPASSRARV